ncbi:MAG: MerR family transcriptional regulator [Lachnospiraceae bacterium]|nr:MerR family transcriptional regulator [Lachnospiraceae bacterium]
MKIKQVSAQLNVSQKTIRYYEQCGLITPVKELKMGREFRDYDEETMTRLRSIVVLRKLRFTIEEIQRIFDEPDSIAEICDVHRQQMSEEIALMTDICALLDEISQEEIADGESLSREIETRRKKMVLDRYLEESDLSKYDESFVDYDLLEENRMAEQNSRVALAASQYFTNSKAVFRLSDDKNQGRWHYLILFSVIALSFLLVSFFDLFIGEGQEEEPLPTDPPIVLSADVVNPTEQDYVEMEQIRVDIRERLIDHPDPELYSEIEGRLNLVGTPDKFYVSCIPFLSWSYEKGTLAYDENLGIWAFDDKKRDGLESNDVFLLSMARDEKGKLHVTGSYTWTLDHMEKNPSARYILMRSEVEYDSIFLREDGKAYLNDYESERLQLQGDFCKRFDWDRMAVCYEEIVNPDNLAVFKFK